MRAATWSQSIDETVDATVAEQFSGQEESKLSLPEQFSDVFQPSTSK
jgi:hypothetical protein